MVATPQIGRKLIYKRRERRFLQRAVQQAVQPQAIQSISPQTPADIMAQWKAEGVIGAWASRTDIGDSAEYARKLRQQAQTREIGR